VGLVSGLRFLLGGDEMGAVWISVGLFVIASHFLPTWSWASRSGSSTAREFRLSLNGRPTDIWIAVGLILLGIVWHILQNVLAFAIVTGASCLAIAILLGWWVSRDDEGTPKERQERHRRDLWRRHAQRRSIGLLRRRH